MMPAMQKKSSVATHPCLTAGFVRPALSGVSLRKPCSTHSLQLTDQRVDPNLSSRLSFFAKLRSLFLELSRCLEQDLRYSAKCGFKG